MLLENSYDFSSHNDLKANNNHLFKRLMQLLISSLHFEKARFNWMPSRFNLFQRN